MKDIKDIEAFNNFVSRTKEEIIREFKDYYNFIKTDEEEIESMTQVYRESLFKLCDKFIEEINKIKIPELTDPWWFYSFTLRHDKIVLELSYCNDLEVDEDEPESLSSMESTAEFVLLEVSCNYLTVSEYAKLHSVSEVTVRQWIRRGKIRSAKKEGKNWLIPEIEERPERGFTSVSYFFKEDIPMELTQKYDFLNGAVSIFITQNKEDSELFNIYVRHKNSKENSLITVSNKKRQIIELDLISSGRIEYEEW